LHFGVSKISELCNKKSKKMTKEQVIELFQRAGENISDNFKGDNRMLEIQKVYFIGIGGIGMSALARYFNAKGFDVCGYDRTETALTQNLVLEGINVHYNDDVDAIPLSYKSGKKNILVVYTPAVPQSHNELQWFISQNYLVMKRSEVLGLVSKNKATIAVAGTHGKTSVSSMLAHLLTTAGIGCDAFLGGISKNYKTNLLLSQGSKYLVAEADEYDRSFLHLHPHLALITSMDADHLDVYGTHDDLKAEFAKFISQITPGGILLIKHGLPHETPNRVHTFTYSLNDRHADFHAENLRLEEDGRYMFTFCAPHKTIHDVHTQAPGLLNVENAVAAMAVAIMAGADAKKIIEAMASFKGVQRRFDFKIQKKNFVYIDDYAHHPEELKYAISSVRELFPGKHITGVFQPHLYTRTRDFAEEFAKSLDLLDALIMLDIYPAREIPIEEVTSKIIFEKVNIENKILCKKTDVVNELKNRKMDVLITLGAGDIDTLVERIEKKFKKN